MEPQYQEILERLNCFSNRINELHDGVRQAIKIAEVDPEMSLTRSRKVLEYIVRAVYERQVGELAGTRPLDNLLQRIVKDGHLPRRIAAYANSVRELGNVGTHGFGESVSRADVLQSLNQLMPVLEWYFEQERRDGHSVIAPVLPSPDDHKLCPPLLDTSHESPTEILPPPPAPTQVRPERAPLNPPAVATTAEIEPTLPEPMTNTIGTKLAPNSVADFLTGSPDPDKDSSGHENPQHRGIFANFLRRFIVKNDGDHDTAAEKLFGTAVSKFKKGNQKGAFKVINKLLITNPSYIKPWEFCGDWYFDNGEYAQALDHYQESIGLGTINPHSYNRAAISAARTGDLEGAYTILKQCTTELSHDDLPGSLWYNLGCYATLLQKNDEAMCYLKEAFNGGFSDNNKYLTDPDLIPLRAREDFSTLLGLANPDRETGQREPP